MAIAVAIMAVAMTLVPLGDTAAKLMMLDHGLSNVFIAWARFTLGALAGLPLVIYYRASLSALLNWRVQLRGAFIICAVMSILTALATEDIGSVFGAFFVGPILSYAASVVLLGERVQPARTALLLVGFLGVLLVVKPGFGMTPGLGFAVLAGVFYAGYLTSARWLSQTAPPAILLFAQLSLGSVVLLPLAVPSIPSGPWPVGLLLLSGLSSFLGNLLLQVAYRRASATAMAPFIYFQLVAATIFGLMVFGTLPDALALAGLGLLVGSGMASLALRPKP